MPTDPVQVPDYPCKTGVNERAVHCPTCDAAPKVYAENQRLRGAVEEHHADFRTITAVLRLVRFSADPEDLRSALNIIDRIVRDD